MSFLHFTFHFYLFLFLFYWSCWFFPFFIFPIRFPFRMSFWWEGGKLWWFFFVWTLCFFLCWQILKGNQRIAVVVSHYKDMAGDYLFPQFLGALIVSVLEEKWSLCSIFSVHGNLDINIAKSRPVKTLDVISLLYVLVDNLFFILFERKTEKISH